MLVIDDDNAPYPEEEVVRLRLENIGVAEGGKRTSTEIQAHNGSVLFVAKGT